MFQWIDARDNQCVLARCGQCLFHQSGTPASSGGDIYRFAAQHTGKEHKLYVDFVCETDDENPPVLKFLSSPQGCRMEISNSDRPGAFRLCVIVPPASLPAEDDELTMDIGGDPDAGVSSCRILFRRTSCKISTALIEQHAGLKPLWPQSHAAVLWYSWKRFQEVIGLKRFTSGKSGSDVLVFRPRLVEPDTTAPTLKGAGLPDVVSRAWGSYLLVKTGDVDRTREEWDRFEAFLIDRLHPFMARNEAFLTVRPEGHPPDEPSHATVIGSFLGGDLLRAEPFKMLVKGGAELERCKDVLERLFSVVSTWYAGASTKPLKDWFKNFRFGDDGQLMLFGKFDLSDKTDRERFALPLAWDTAFVKKDHLSRHLIGKNRDGLLYRLMEMPVRYSLTHGDLHPENILADSSNVWLIDFGETGVAPTLFDFAKLEVYLRLWCLDMTPGVKNFEAAAIEFETLLLDNMTASEASLEPVRGLAPSLGASPDVLFDIAECISLVRKRAVPYCLGSPDRRDYLAVLYITVLNTLRFAGTDPALVENFRLLVGLFWQLEDALSLIHGMKPFPRERVPVDPRHLVTRKWLAAPGAPARVLYLMDHADGRAALAPLAATQGVLQSQYHHLDVFHHALLALAYVEELISDPIGSFLDPVGLDKKVEEALKRQGIQFLSAPFPENSEDRSSIMLQDDERNDLNRLFEEILDEETKVLLKWIILFHDVGKPATRSMGVGTGSSNGKVQFFGHEVYGQQLIADHVTYLFPDEGDQGLFDYLITRHHDHHNIVNRYIDATRFKDVEEALKTHELPSPELKYLSSRMDPGINPYGEYFPLLILHGFADMLACRGPERRISMARMAHIDLTMLRLFMCYPKIKHRNTMKEKFGAMSKGLNKILDINGPPLGQVTRDLKKWFLDLTCSDAFEEGSVLLPTREEIEKKAEEIKEELGIYSQ